MANQTSKIAGNCTLLKLLTLTKTSKPKVIGQIFNIYIEICKGFSQIKIVFEFLKKAKLKIATSTEKERMWKTKKKKKKKKKKNGNSGFL